MGMRYGIPLKAPLTDTTDTRYDFRNLVVCNADGSPRGGLTSFTGPPLLFGTASMQTSVRPFSAVAARDGGVVLLASDATVTVTHDAAPAANSRIDLIYAKQNDSSSTVSIPDANDLPVIGIVKGTAAALPVSPALPNGAVDLGSVLIAAGVTSTNAAVIAQSRVFTAAAGGSVLFSALDDLNSWTTARVGQHAYVSGDTPVWRNGDYEFDGAVWKFVGTAVWDITPATGWTAGTGPNKPRLRRVGDNVFAQGSLAWVGGGAYSNFFTVPIDFRPTTLSAPRNVGTAAQVSGTTLLPFNVQVSTAGVVGQGGGVTGSLPASGAVLLTGIMFTID